MSLHRFAQWTAAATFLLLMAGGLVTSTGSGLAIPDWPLAYGGLVPPLVGGIRFEYGHRVIAGVVALLTLGLALWLQRAEPRRWVRRLGWAAAGAVLLQALLGGVTVRLHLPPAVSIAHACLGQTFFCLVVAAALVTAPSWPVRTALPAAQAGTLRRWSLLLLGVVYLQLILGARLRHTGAGLTAHVTGAALVAATTLLAAWQLTAHLGLPSRLRRAGWWLLVLLTAQVGLGLASWRWEGALLITTAHVAVGAAFLAAALAVVLETLRGQRLRLDAGAYLALTKPRITLLAVLTTVVGYLVAGGGRVEVAVLVPLLAGTALVVGGAGALNQYLERDADALMARTKRRPLPSGRLTPRQARWWGWALALSGLVVLAALVNRPSAWLAAAALLIYLYGYTPLKRRTTLCTLLGAVPGAMPPLVGWAGARGQLSTEAWWLFAILFLWQLPHFLAIAWLYRDDYARAGFKMLPLVDPQGTLTGRQIVVYALALVPVTLAPTLLGLTGMLYFAGALLLGLVFLGVSLWTALVRSNRSARRLFLTSLAYLPCLFLLMTCNLTASASISSGPRCCPPAVSQP